MLPVHESIAFVAGLAVKGVHVLISASVNPVVTDAAVVGSAVVCFFRVVVVVEGVEVYFLFHLKLSPGMTKCFSCLLFNSLKKNLRQIIDT